MPITQVGTATGTVSTSGTTPSSISVSKPTGVASGDVLIATFTHTVATGPGTITGWTQFSTDQNSTLLSELFYKVAGGSEPSSYTFNASTTGSPLAGSISAWRGVDTTGSPIDAVQSSNAATATEPATGPALTTAQALTRCFTVRSIRYGTNASFSFSSAVGSVTELNDLAAIGGTTAYGHCFYQRDADETSAGSKTAIATTCSVAETHNVFHTFSLKVLGIPATGTFDASIPLVVSDVAATREIPAGPISLDLPSLAVDFAGTAAPPSGSIDLALPLVTPAFAGTIIHGTFAASIPSITSDFVGGQSYGSLNLTLPLVTTAVDATSLGGAFSTELSLLVADFVAESRKFGEHVIVVEADDRAFRVTDDGTGIIDIKRSQVTTA